MNFNALSASISMNIIQYLWLWLQLVFLPSAPSGPRGYCRHLRRLSCVVLRPASSCVRPYFLGGFRPIKSKFLNRLTSNLGLLLRGARLSSLLIFRKIGPILALWRPKNLQKSGQIDTHRQRFPTDKVKVSQPIDF